MQHPQAMLVADPHVRRRVFPAIYFLPALILAHRARCAAAIRSRASADIVRRFGRPRLPAISAATLGGRPGPRLTDAPEEFAGVRRVRAGCCPRHEKGFSPDIASTSDAARS